MSSNRWEHPASTNDDKISTAVRSCGILIETLVAHFRYRFQVGRRVPTRMTEVRNTLLPRSEYRAVSGERDYEHKGLQPKWRKTMLAIRSKETWIAFSIIPCPCGTGSACVGLLFVLEALAKPVAPSIQTSSRFANQTPLKITRNSSAPGTIAQHNATTKTWARVISSCPPRLRILCKSLRPK